MYQSQTMEYYCIQSQVIRWLNLSRSPPTIKKQTPPYFPQASSQFHYALKDRPLGKSIVWNDNDFLMSRKVIGSQKFVWMTFSLVYFFSHRESVQLVYRVKIYICRYPILAQWANPIVNYRCVIMLKPPFLFSLLMIRSWNIKQP